MRATAIRRGGVVLAALAGAVLAVHAQAPPFTVRITSPLGRSGIPGTVRIVAQVAYTASNVPREARFYVDHELLATVDGPPPYATEWLDDNPFERRELEIAVTNAVGAEARDVVVLDPFEVEEVAEVRSVLLEASVQDRKGRFVRGLDAPAFHVAENGVPQRLDVVSPEVIGATFALMVDRSGSMSRRMDFVQRTAATLASYLGPKDRMILAPFGMGLAAQTGPTDDRPTILEGIRAITPGGGTAILDSLAQMARAMAGTEGRHAIVLITDGYDERSTTSVEDVMAAIRAAGATVYVVGIGGVAGISIKGERMLRQLATETGGRFFFPQRDEQLPAVHDTLTEDVQNRYLITYTPSNQAADGTWREVALTMTDPTLVVRTRAGYEAPKPPPIRARLEFTALDAAGRFLSLSSSDLLVDEGGAAQTVETFQEAVDPVSVVLALDASGSMKRREADVVASAREFIDALQPRDALALVLFGDRVRFVHDLSRDRDFSRSALDEYVAKGGTALYDALADGLARLRHVEGRRVVVVMTDGRDEDNAGTAAGSTRTMADVMALVKESGAMVYTIGLGANVERPILQRLADASGGRAFFPADVASLASEYAQVVKTIRRRYIVGYTSTITTRDGKWREVDIRVKDHPDATIRSAGGYYAPAK